MISTPLYTKDYHRGILKKFQIGTIYQKDKSKNVLNLVAPCKEDVILDVGCSSGSSTFILGGQGAKVTGIDMDKEAIEVALEYQESSGHIYSHCNFYSGLAEEAIEEIAPNKVTMIDLTEHVPDEDLTHILTGLLKTPNPFTLYIYTPCRTHWIERLKAHNFLLKQDDTHIALRDMAETVGLLEKSGFKVLQSYYRPSHLPVVKHLEKMLAVVPLIGLLFKRRLLLSLKPAEGER